MATTVRLGSTLSIAAFVALLTAPPLLAQDFNSERVLRTWQTDVKLQSGDIDRWTFTIAYDPVEGLYTRTAVDTSGRVVDSIASEFSMAAPTEGEIEYARQLILTDRELQPLIDSAARPFVEGGFELVRRDNPSCSAGSRCLQFDLMDAVVPGEHIKRIRYIIVDMRTGQILDRDVNPVTEANIRRPNLDR
ncbi:MAG: hypothetical protein R3284_03875 [Rubricoccaceae bacterium]|nr:hypothetical protein [Rubricoccaceae bacterium]